MCAHTATPLAQVEAQTRIHEHSCIRYLSLIRPALRVLGASRLISTPLALLRLASVCSFRVSFTFSCSRICERVQAR